MRTIQFNYIQLFINLQQKKQNKCAKKITNKQKNEKFPSRFSLSTKIFILFLKRNFVPWQVFLFNNFLQKLFCIFCHCFLPATKHFLQLLFCKFLANLCYFCCFFAIFVGFFALLLLFCSIFATLASTLLFAFFGAISVSFFLLFCVPS